MSIPLVLIGGGGHARVLAEAARSTGAFDLIGYLDRAPSPETERLIGLRCLGDDHWLDGHDEVSLSLGVGSAKDVTQRRAIVERLALSASRWSVVVHANAWVSPTASLAAGVSVFAGAIVQTGARVDFQAIVNSGAVVEHDVEVGEFAQLAPGAVVGGGATIGACAFIGLGARVRDHVRVGAGAVVGMGSVVVSDVPPGCTVVGVPARPVRRQPSIGVR